MRKWIVWLLILLVSGLGAVFVFIPNRIQIQEIAIVHANAKAFERSFNDSKKWQQWWPGERSTSTNINGNSGLYFNGQQYSITERSLSYIMLTSKGKMDSFSIQILSAPLGQDSIELQASSVLQTSLNPFDKIEQWMRSKKIAADLRTILQQMQSFYANEKNLYGIEVIEERVKDSTLISTFTQTSTYPTMKTIYTMVDELQTYIHRFDAKKTGFPMLNISRQADSSYLTRLALPVNRQLPNEGNIQYRKLLYNGKILVTEVKGGPATINSAMNQLENFVSDHQKVAPAIPFQSLITDRIQEPDTTKWLTKIYWPIM